ncbi:MAG: phage tail assembly chaperone [Burkholderiales bacterium]
MLKLIANPTYTETVKIPAPGGDVTLKCEFKHFDTDAYDAMFAKWQAAGTKAKEALPDVLVGWSDVDAEFTPENLERLCKNYHRAPVAIMDAFIGSLTGARLGN